MKDLLEELIDIKKQKKIKNNELALALDVSYVTVSQWVTGLKLPSFKNLKSFADAMGYEIKLVPKDESRK